MNVFFKQHDKGGEADRTAVVKKFLRAAEQGNAFAQCELGICYDLGRGVAQDKTEALKWFRKSSDKGNASAQNRVGYYYMEGWGGLTKDPVMAVAWFRKAAEQGQRVAQYNLGFCYYCGKGVTKDVAEAIKWIKRSADGGYAKAQNNLNLLQKEGGPSRFLRPGTELLNGRYRVIRMLEIKQDSILYEAEQVSLNRKVDILEFFMEECCQRHGINGEVFPSLNDGDKESFMLYRNSFVRKNQSLAESYDRVLDLFEDKGTAYVVTPPAKRIMKE